MKKSKPNFLVILIDDLRYDEFGAGGHPYMKTPHIDRLAHEGALFERAFHTTSICSPNRASIVTGQYASRHGIIDNVARGAMSHRLPNYHLELQKLGYETAHIGKWHMGNDGMPRPGYDYWVSYDGHGRIVEPEAVPRRQVRRAHGLHHRHHERPGGRVPREAEGRQALVAVLRAQGGASGRRAGRPTARCRSASWAATSPAERHKDLYKDAIFPKKPNMLSYAEVMKQKPAWTEIFKMRAEPKSRELLDCDPRRHAGGDPPARAHDGLGGRGRRHDPRHAGEEGRARQHLHHLPRRQRLLLRRARPRAGATVRLRGGNPLSFPGALSEDDQSRIREIKICSSARTSRPR